MPTPLFATLSFTTSKRPSGPRTTWPTLSYITRPLASKYTPPPVPRSTVLEGYGREIVIDWKDGGRTAVTAFDLRRLCPCASCVNEISGDRMLRSEDVDPAIVAVSFHKVGRYGLQFQWSDGHGTGIYTHRMLRVIEAELE